MNAWNGYEQPYPVCTHVMNTYRGPGRLIARAGLTIAASLKLRKDGNGRDDLVTPPPRWVSAAFNLRQVIPLRLPNGRQATARIALLRWPGAVDVNGLEESPF